MTEAARAGDVAPPEEWYSAVVLENEWVRLEPIGLRHVGELTSAGSDAAIWRWMPAAVPAGEDDMARIVLNALAEQRRRMRVAFAVLSAGRAIGSTSYLDIAPEHRQLEIGWTWYTTAAQRTAVNAASKLLLLTRAFERLGADRVALKTDSRNDASNAAIAQLGARFEGTLRAHRLRPDGTARDTNYFSILRAEWPEVRERLEWRLRPAG